MYQNTSNQIKSNGIAGVTSLGFHIGVMLITSSGQGRCYCDKHCSSSTCKGLAIKETFPYIYIYIYIYICVPVACIFFIVSSPCVIEVFECFVAIVCTRIMKQARTPSCNSEPGSPKFLTGHYMRVFFFGKHM